VSQRPSYRIVVLLSGRGSNFSALNRAVSSGDVPAQIVKVVSDKAGARGLQIARDAGIETAVVERRPKERSNSEFNRELADEVESAAPDLVVLAGFMRVLTSDFISRFRGRIINIHPSLLPAFPGLSAQRQALEAGVKISGCTVHVALEEIDAGPILGQSSVPVLAGDNEEMLSERILKQEHKLLPAVVRALATGALKIECKDDGNIEVIGNKISISS